MALKSGKTSKIIKRGVGKKSSNQRLAISQKKVIIKSLFQK